MAAKEKIIHLVHKLYLPNWLIWLLLGVVMLRLPTLFEPYAYGDEMIYLTLGQGIRQGVPLYLGLHDNKPPLLYVIAAIAGNLFWFKAILAGWCLTTTVIFWKLTHRLFPQNSRLQQLATAIFALLTTIPTLEGNIANAELFFLSPIIAGFYLLFSRPKTPRNLFLSGGLFSLAALFKIPAIFDLPAIVFFWLITGGINPTNLKKTIVNCLYLGAGLILPLALTFGWFASRGAFYPYLVAAFLQNFGYVSSWRAGGVTIPFLVKNGPLLIRFLVVMAGSGVLYWQRRRLPKEFIFLCLWLLFSLFAVTLSERPYPHYLLQAVPALSCLLAILFTHPGKIQAWAIIPISLAFLVPVYFKFWYYPTSTYYLRFFKLLTRQITRNDYLSQFDANTTRNYELARLVVSLTQPKDKIYVWGDTATMYALTRRLPPTKYVADYHIRDFSSPQEVIQSLQSHNPAVIIVMPNSDQFSQLQTLIFSRYALVANINGAQVYKLLNPKVLSALQRHF